MESYLNQTSERLPALGLDPRDQVSTSHTPTRTQPTDPHSMVALEATIQGPHAPIPPQPAGPGAIKKEDLRERSMDD